MYDYPSIGYRYDLVVGRKCVVSEKIDGHNFRAEFNKGEFSKLGTRTVLTGPTIGDQVFAKASQVFFEMYAESLKKVLEKAKVRRAVVFGEVYGSATHLARLDYGVPMDWTFFDIFDIQRKSFIEPKETMQMLDQNVPVPKWDITHVDRNLINEMREDDTPNFEGWVIKPQREVACNYAKAKTAWFMRTIGEV